MYVCVYMIQVVHPPPPPSNAYGSQVGLGGGGGAMPPPPVVVVVVGWGGGGKWTVQGANPLCTISLLALSLRMLYSKGCRPQS